MTWTPARKTETNPPVHVKPKVTWGTIVIIFVIMFLVVGCVFDDPESRPKKQGYTVVVIDGSPVMVSNEELAEAERQKQADRRQTIGIVVVLTVIFAVCVAIHKGWLHLD